MKNVFILEGSEQEPPFHVNVRKGGGGELSAPGGGGGPHGIGDGFIDLWAPTRLGIIIKITGVGDDCVGK